MCRVEFFKIGKRDVTFIREMRVHNTLYTNALLLVPATLLDDRVDDKGDDKATII